MWFCFFTKSLIKFGPQHGIFLPRMDHYTFQGWGWATFWGMKFLFSHLGCAWFFGWAINLAGFFPRGCPCTIFMTRFMRLWNTQQDMGSNFWVTSGQIAHTGKNGLHLEKRFTPGQMGHKNAAHLKTCVRLEKMRHNSKYATHLEKCATLLKIRHIRKNAAHSKTCGTLGKMHHTFKNAPRFHKCGTLGKMHHSWNNTPHF